VKSRRQVRSAGCDRGRSGGRRIKKQKLPAGIPILQWTALSTRPTSFSWTSVTKADACAKNGNFIVEAVCPEPEGDPVSWSGCTPRSGTGPIVSRFRTRVVSSCSARILRSSKIVRRRASKPGSGSPVRGRFGRQKPSSFVASRNGFGGCQGSSCTNVRYSAHLGPNSDIAPCRRRAHVWTAPSWQGLSSRVQYWSVRPCVRPTNAVHVTAGHNALRGSGPGQ
jgi:hypothetical protein